MAGFIDFAKRAYLVFIKILVKLYFFYHCSFIWRIFNWKKKIKTVNLAAVDLWGGNAQQGHAVLNGFFVVKDCWGGGYKASWSNLDEMFSNNEYMMSYICSFEWIRDLKATGDMSARRLARRAVEYWIKNKFRKTKRHLYKECIEVVAAKRLSVWILLYNFFGASSQDVFKNVFLVGLQEEYRDLKILLRKRVDIASHLNILKALVEYNVYCEYDKSFFYLLLRSIAESLPLVNILHTSGMTSAITVFYNFCLVIEIRNSLLQCENFFLKKEMKGLDGIRYKNFKNTFNVVQSFLKNTVPIVRFFRHSNGELCRFKLSSLDVERFFREKINPGKIDVALSQVDSNVAIAKLKNESVVRFAEKNTVLFISRKIESPINKVFKGYGRNIADNAFDLEWSFQSTSIVKKSTFSIFQKSNFPSFFNSENFPDIIRDRFVSDFFEKSTLEGFHFKGNLNIEETSARCFCLERDVKLLPTESLLKVIDLIGRDSSSNDSFAVVQIYLGDNLKLIDLKDTKNSNSSSLRYSIESPLNVGFGGKKINKSKSFCEFTATSQQSLWVKNSSSEKGQVITIFLQLLKNSQATVNWSLQIVK